MLETQNKALEKSKTMKENDRIQAAIKLMDDAKVAETKRLQIQE